MPLAKAAFLDITEGKNTWQDLTIVSRITFLFREDWRFQDHGPRCARRSSYAERWIPFRQVIPARSERSKGFSWCGHGAILTQSIAAIRADGDRRR